MPPISPLGYCTISSGTMPTSVLPRAQYGDESAASVSVDGAHTYFKLRDAADPTIGPVFSGSSLVALLLLLVRLLVKVLLTTLMLLWLRIKWRSRSACLQLLISVRLLI